MTQELTKSSLEVVAQGLEFPESPRWMGGDLLVSDMSAKTVLRISGGSIHQIADVPQRPSGLGWSPTGALLIVSMIDARVMRINDRDEMEVVADLRPITRGSLNDMVVSPTGFAYVGDTGFKWWIGEPVEPGTLILVRPDGTAQIVATDIATPNGLALSADGQTLLVAETHGNRLTQFAVAPDGSLGDRRVFANVPAGPDGICLDSDGAAWVAIPSMGQVLRVEEGGAILSRIVTDDHVVACVLGGNDRRTLFICSGNPDFSLAVGDGVIRSTRVVSPGAGQP